MDLLALFHLGVSQLEDALVRTEEAAGSSPATQTMVTMVYRLALEAVNLPDRVRVPVVTPMAPEASGDAACLSSRVETGSIPVGAARFGDVVQREDTAPAKRQ